MYEEYGNRDPEITQGIQLHGYQSMSIPYLQRSFRVLINLQNGNQINVANTTNLLECTFSCENSLRSAYYFANISLYNLAPETSQQIVSYGDEVELYGGYEADNGEQNLLFKGKVFQPMFERVNVVDTKLTLRCFVFLLSDQSSYVTVTLPPGSTGLDAFRAVANAASITATNVDESILTSKTYPAGVTFNCRGTAALAQIASDATVLTKNKNVEFWTDQNGVNLRSIMTQPGQKPDVIYCPSNNGTSVLPSSMRNAKPILLETPIQTQAGVSFVTLLDSSIRLGTVVQLTNTNIIQAQRTPQPNTGSLISPLSTDGQYVVVAFRHVGNSRSGDWSTEITSVTNPLLTYGLS